MRQARRANTSCAASKNTKLFKSPRNVSIRRQAELNTDSSGSTLIIIGSCRNALASAPGGTRHVAFVHPLPRGGGAARDRCGDANVVPFHIVPR